MVSTLNAPNHDDVQLIAQIVEQRQNGKHADYFSEYQIEWETRVVEYIDSQGNPEIIAESIIPDNEKDRFINLYKSKEIQNVQVPIIKSIRDSDLLVCPACGEMGNPETVDHYLPKTVYPEYAIITKNLFPMCSKCQTSKGSGVLTNEGEKQFIHPYYDKITKPVLQLLISEPYSSPHSFHLCVRMDIEEPLRSLVDRHLTGMKIRDRFNKFCTESYMNLLRLADDSKECEIRFRSYLAMFLKEAELKSLNSWPAIFYRSILDNNELLDYLEGGELPNFL